MTTEVKSAEDILGSIIGSQASGKGIAGVIDSKEAPAQIGKPVFKGDLEFAKLTGAKSFADLFGQKVSDKSDQTALPVNFGRKSQVGFMPTEVHQRLFHFKKMLNNMEIQAQIMFKGQHISPDMLKETPAYKNFLQPMLKAYDVTDFSQWIPTLNTRFYFEEYELPFLLANEFDQMPMESTTMEVPGDLGHLEGFEETDAATFAAQSTTSDNYSVTARNNVVHAQITQDLIADSFPAYLDKLRRNVLSGNARAYEKALISGDTTGSPRGSSHQDSDIAALALNATFSKAFDGLRKKAFANDATLGAGSIVYDHGGDTASKPMFAAMMNLMGKFASEKGDLVWVLPSSVENQVVTGAIPELFTAFAFGSLASNVTGQMPPIFGVKPITSEFMREDLNASGVYDGVTETRTAALLVKRSRFMNFIRQAARVWAAPSLPSSDIMLMTSKIRHTFNGNPQSANEKSVVMAINVAKA